jgi:hypothetical protein
MRIKTQQGLNPIQLHILQMFNRPMTKKEMDEIKDILVEYFDKKAQKEMDKIWKENKLSQKKINEMGNSHTRTPYK